MQNAKNLPLCHPFRHNVKRLIFGKNAKTQNQHLLRLVLCKQVHAQQPSNTPAKQVFSFVSDSTADTEETNSKFATKFGFYLQDAAFMLP